MLANQSSDRGQYLKSLQEASEPQYKEEEAILAKFTAEQNAMRKAVARQKKKRLKRDRQYNQSQPLAAPLFEVEKNKSYASTPIEYTKKDSDGKIHILPAKALKELSRGTKNLFKSHSKMLDDYMAMYEQELQYVTSKQIARERARKRLEKNASKYTRKERKEYEIGRMSEEVNSVVDVYKEKSGANYNNYNQAIAAGITLLVGGFKEVAAIAAIFPNMVALAPILSSMLAIKSILGDLGRVSIEAALNLEKSNLAFKNTSLSLSEANNIPLGNTLQDLSRDKGESNKRVVDSMAERKSASIAQARDLFANIQGATIGSKSPLQGYQQKLKNELLMLSLRCKPRA
jgi:hypothetical protein